MPVMIVLAPAGGPITRALRVWVCWIALSIVPFIAHGPQQVNNAPQPPAERVSRARESENPTNKLLVQQRNEWLDGGTTQATGSSNSSVEALEAIHGAKDARE